MLTSLEHHHGLYLDKQDLLLAIGTNGFIRRFGLQGEGLFLELESYTVGLQ